MAPTDARRDGIACPECQAEGEKRVYVHGRENGRAFCRWQWLLCGLCGGLGFITEARQERVEAGHRLREDRVARGVTLREEARRLGMTAKQLSDKEWARHDR